MKHKASLHCAGCGKYLGDNNDLITSGPHMGARPTDLTTLCEVTGKQEAVTDSLSHLESQRIRDSAWVRMTLPPMVEDQTDWKLYSEYRVPVGRDLWPWRHWLVFRLLMFFHACADRAWRLIWKLAQRTWKFMMFWNDSVGHLRQWLWKIAQPFKEPHSGG